jgi:hypothetical protein
VEAPVLSFFLRRFFRFFCGLDIVIISDSALNNRLSSAYFLTGCFYSTVVDFLSNIVGS